MIIMIGRHNLIRSEGCGDDDEDEINGRDNVHKF